MYLSYDFGLRAIKTTLLTAGSHKLAAKEDMRTLGGDEEDTDERKRASEAMILVKALMDCNVPKLLADDIVLFKGTQHSIIKSLF